MTADDGVRCARIELDGVHHTHGEGGPWAQPALHGIDLTLDDGDRLLVVGTNGSGKSTLAWILAGMIGPSHGSATIDGEPLVDRRREIGLVIQQTRLQLLRPTVGEELSAFTSDLLAQLDALDRMGLAARDLGRRIDELSIGQQRRVGLAAQLARRAPLLILDEPMAGLDRPARSALAAAVDHLPPSTIVVTVTHDLEDSRPLGDRMIELDDGRIRADRTVR